MKRIKMIRLMLVLATPGFCPAESAACIPEAGSIQQSLLQDPWLARDKAQHFLASFLLTGAMMYRFRYHEGWDAQDSRIGAAGFTLSLGLAKEWRDQFKSPPYNRFSWKDLIADFAGVALGILMLEWW